MVDDRSEDTVWNYLRDVASADGRFRLLRKPPHLERGCQTSKNLAIEHCSGDFVTFLDSDDLMSRRCLQDRQRELADYPETDLLVGKQALFYDQDERVFWVNVPREDCADLDRFLALAAPVDVPWVNGGSTIRLSKLRECGIHWRSEFCWEDAVFHFECLARGFRVHWMKRDGCPDTFYRIHGNTMGGDLWQVNGIQNAAEMLQWMVSELRKSGLLTRERLRRIAKSYFHVCVLRSIDLGWFAIAATMARKGLEASLWQQRRAFVLRLFILARWVTRRSKRSTFYANRIARRFLSGVFDPSEELTYGAVVAAYRETDWEHAAARGKMVRPCSI